MGRQADSTEVAEDIAEVAETGNVLRARAAAFGCQVD